MSYTRNETWTAPPPPPGLGLEGGTYNNRNTTGTMTSTEAITATGQYIGSGGGASFSYSVYDYEEVLRTHSQADDLTTFTGDGYTTLDGHWVRSETTDSLLTHTEIGSGLSATWSDDFTSHHSYTLTIVNANGSDTWTWGEDANWSASATYTLEAPTPTGIMHNPLLADVDALFGRNLEGMGFLRHVTTARRLKSDIPLSTGGTRKLDDGGAGDALQQPNHSSGGNGANGVNDRSPNYQAIEVPDPAVPLDPYTYHRFVKPTQDGKRIFQGDYLQSDEDFRRELHSRYERDKREHAWQGIKDGFVMSLNGVTLGLIDSLSERARELRGEYGEGTYWFCTVSGGVGLVAGALAGGMALGPSVGAGVTWLGQSIFAYGSAYFPALWKVGELMLTTPTGQGITIFIVASILTGGDYEAAGYMAFEIWLQSPRRPKAAKGNAGAAPLTSRADFHIQLRSQGYQYHHTTKGGYVLYRHPNGSQIWIRPNGQVIRTGPPVTPSGGGKAYPPRVDASGNTITTHDPNEFVEPLPGN
jgi:hypothetical protein